MNPQRIVLNRYTITPRMQARTVLDPHKPAESRKLRNQVHQDAALITVVWGQAKPVHSIIESDARLRLVHLADAFSAAYDVEIGTVGIPFDLLAAFAHHAILLGFDAQDIAGALGVTRDAVVWLERWYARGGDRQGQGPMRCMKTNTNTHYAAYSEIIRDARKRAETKPRRGVRQKGTGER